MNKAILIGRLTKEPELRSTASGVSVCTFTIAVDRRFKQEGQPSADFIPVVVWRGQADNCAKYLHKGSQCAICGSIQTRDYDAPDGTKRYITEVIADEVQFLNTKANEPENALKTPENVLSRVEDEEVPF
jgi:single-strand DNA-binding protein